MSSSLRNIGLEPLEVKELIQQPILAKPVEDHVTKILQEMFSPNIDQIHFKDLMECCYEIEKTKFHLDAPLTSVISNDVWLMSAYKGLDTKTDLEVISRRANGLIHQYLGIKTESTERVLCRAILRERYLDTLLIKVNMKLNTPDDRNKLRSFSPYQIVLIVNLLNDYFIKRLY